MTRVRVICTVVSGLMSLVATMIVGIVEPQILNFCVWLLFGFAALWLILGRLWYGFLKTDT